LLEALAMSKKPAKLILVGDQGNVRFFKELKSKINELGIHDKVEFREFIGDDELLDLYQHAISVVLPARITKDSFEGFPMIIFEANAAGTPVICTRGFGADYAIVEGKNGFLIEQESVFQLAKALIAAQQLNRDSGMQESCLKVASDHDWKKIGLQILDFYK
jgi:glycosyltransferase involved in cell wall biosynthesis